MSRLRTIHRCTECAAAHPKWAGRCPACGAWNSLVEDVEEVGPRPPASVPAGLPPRRARSPRSTWRTAGRWRRACPELDRVLGGGARAGLGHAGRRRARHRQVHPAPAGRGGAGRGGQRRALRLGGGERGAGPGPGRAARRPGAGAVAALGDRAAGHRRGAGPDPARAGHRRLHPDRGRSRTWPSSPGSIVQVRESAHRLVQEAKRRGVAIVLIGHVTKDGALAGPRLLEHVVDTVLSFEGDRHHALRLLRAVKHRYGPTSELGLFEMADAGLVGVADASGMFLADRCPGIAGSVVVPTLEGHRPLAGRGAGPRGRPPRCPTPRRSAQGFDQGRLALLVAVLSNRVGLPFGNQDVYASVVGGRPPGRAGQRSRHLPGPGLGPDHAPRCRRGSHRLRRGGPGRRAPARWPRPLAAWPRRPAWASGGPSCRVSAPDGPGRGRRHGGGAGGDRWTRPSCRRSAAPRPQAAARGWDYGRTIRVIGPSPARERDRRRDTASLI